MEEKEMKKIIFIVFMVLLASQVAVAKDFELKKKVGSIEVILKLDKNPPIAGDNNLSVILNDEGGKPIKDAKVQVEYSMPPMPGMPASSYKANLDFKGEAYKAKINFSMSGAWNVAIKVNRAGKAVSAKFNIDVR